MIGRSSSWLWLAPALGLALFSEAGARDWIIEDPAVRSVRALADAGRYQAVLDTVPALIGLAIARGDSMQLGRLLCLRGQGRLGVGQIGASLTDLERAATLTEASSDTLFWMTALGVRAFALNQRGRYEDALQLSQRQIELALPAGDTVGRAFAHLATGYANLSLQRIPEARDSYSVAIGLFRAQGLTNYELVSLVGLGRAVSYTKDWREARAIQLSVVELARSAGDRRNEADATNNLGVLEVEEKRYDRAASYFERAYRLQLELGNGIEAIPIMSSYAVILSWTGRHEEAARILEQARSLARDGGATDHFHAVTVDLAAVKLNQGARGEAIRLYREAIAERMDAGAAVGLGAALIRADSLDAAQRSILTAQAWCERNGRPSRDLSRMLIQIDLARGRLPEALARARGFASNPSDVLEATTAPALLAQCLAAVGEVDSALVQLEPAVRGFELFRSETADLGWREIGSAMVYRRVLDPILACAARESQRLEIANLLLRVKARNIIDRLEVGEDRSGSLRPLSAGALQSRLGPRDLLLDYYVGSERVMVLAMTADVWRIAQVSDDPEALREHTQAWVGMISAPDGGQVQRRVQAAAARRLYELLIGPADDLVASANRILVAPDGFLAAVPMNALLGGGDRIEPLGLRADVVRVPTPSLIGHRSAEVEPTSGILALLEREGELLGAEAEVDALRRQYHGVQTMRGHPGDPTRLREGSAILHVAAHVDARDDLAWTSGVRLESADQTSGGETHLRAKDILDTDLTQRLVFLAACGSGLGRQQSGQGVLGLSTAFLVAQVPSVIATLWPVDDLTTARLVEVFYRSLATGRTVASALRAAQIEVRSNDATADPYYWAGFFLLGDPDTKVELQARGWVRPWWILLLLLGVMALGIGFSRRARASASR